MFEFERTICIDEPFVLTSQANRSSMFKVQMKKIDIQLYGYKVEEFMIGLRKYPLMIKTVSTIYNTSYSQHSVCDLIDNDLVNWNGIIL